MRMKEFVNRLDNLAANLQDERCDQGQAYAQLCNIRDDMNEYKAPNEMTDVEYADINLLADIATRNAKVGDGMDAELVKHIQDAQKIIMLRVGSRAWTARTE